MTKAQGVAIAGSASRLAKLLGISRSAVAQWGDKIPPFRVLQLKAKMPERFSQQSKEGQS